MSGRRGRIGGQEAEVVRDAGDRLLLRWRGTAFDFTTTQVRHRDDDGTVTFSVDDASATYPRAGPSARDRAWDAVDFTADEPWSWEDGDFGLFVFHVATGGGPVKYRHLLEPRDPTRTATSAWPPRLDDAGGTRPRTNARSEAVRWDTLVEVRAKFEVAGIWSEPTTLVLDAGDDLVVAPPLGANDLAWAREQLTPRLRTLPGWQDGPLERALAYAERREIGPTPPETIHDWAEAGIWSRA